MTGPRNLDLAALARTLGAICQEAGALVRARAELPRDVHKKGPFDLVTDADRASEALIARRLEEAFPGAHLLLEESGAGKIEGQGFEALTFIADPLDGTTNFAAGIPHVGVSLAAERGGEVVAGAIYDPFRDELFLAARGLGARLGARPLKVRATRSIEDAVVVTGFAYKRIEQRDDNHAEFCAMNLLSRGARRFGAATLDLAWLAAGRFDVFWERGLKAWDLAAGVLLVEEAGGRVTNYRGEPCDIRKGEVLATGGPLHDEVRAILERTREIAGVSGPNGSST